MFDNPFRKNKQDEPKEQLLPTPVPALVALLLSKEREKGAPLTENEVLEIRDNAACIMLPISARELMDDSRGYLDLNPDCVWE